MERGPAEGDERPWEQPGCVRRDCEPHRGRLLLAVGNVSLFCGFFTVAFFFTALVGLAVGNVSLLCGALSFALFPALVGLLCGITAWWMARRDLGRMGTGLMDPAGKGPTERALYWAGEGVGTGLVSGACNLVYLAQRWLL